MPSLATKYGTLKAFERLRFIMNRNGDNNIAVVTASGLLLTRLSLVLTRVYLDSFIPFDLRRSSYRTPKHRDTLLLNHLFALDDLPAESILPS